MTIIGNRTTSVYFVWARNANGNYSFLRSKKKKNRATNYYSARTIAHFLGNSSTPRGKMEKKPIWRVKF